MLECGYSHLELRLVEAVEAAEAVVPAVVLNTKDSGTFHGRGRKKGVTKSSPEKNIEIVVHHQCHSLFTPNIL